MDICIQFWFIIENKKNTGSHMGHTKKKNIAKIDLKKTFNTATQVQVSNTDTYHFVYLWIAINTRKTLNEQSETK